MAFAFHSLDFVNGSDSWSTEVMRDVSLVDIEQGTLSFPGNLGFVFSARPTLETTRNLSFFVHCKYIVVFFK